MLLGLVTLVLANNADMPGAPKCLSGIHGNAEDRRHRIKRLEITCRKRRSNKWEGNMIVAAI